MRVPRSLESSSRASMATRGPSGFDFFTGDRLACMLGLSFSDSNGDCGFVECGFVTDKKLSRGGETRNDYLKVPMRARTARTQSRVT